MGRACRGMGGLGLLLDFEGWIFSLWTRVCSGGYGYIAKSRHSVARADVSLRTNTTPDSYYSLSANTHLFLIISNAPSHLCSVYISSRSCYARCSHLEFDRALNTELGKFTLSHVQIKTSNWRQ
jgi:hypothetical protein